MPDRRWIFVTGMPRSGTTFVGSMLAAPLCVDYLHEPFSPQCGVQGVDWRNNSVLGDDWRPLDPMIRRAVASALAMKCRLKCYIPATDSFGRRLAKRLTGGRGNLYLLLARLNPWGNVGILKDPVGWVFAKYVTDEFGATPVVVVKHPVSQVASIARAGWETHFSAFRENACVRALLEPEDLQALARPPERPELRCALKWRMMYRVLGRLAEQNSWPSIRIEDISADPINQFQSLYCRFDLPWSTRVVRRIERQTKVGNRIEAHPNRLQDLKRDSRMIFEYRRNSVVESLRRDILSITWPVASRWYDLDSFSISDDAGYHEVISVSNEGK